MSSICGIVNYEGNSAIQDLESLSYNSGKGKRFGFSHFNRNGAFIGLSSDNKSSTPHSIIYKNVRYTFVLTESCIT